MQAGGQNSGATGRAPMRIAAIYAVIAGLWILFSDAALGLFVHDAGLIAKISIFKGWIFVAVTSALLYYLIKRHTGLIERARADEEQSRRRFQSLFEQAGDAIFLAAPPDGRIVAANASSAVLLGYGLSELLTMRLADCLADSERGRLTDMVGKMDAYRIERGEWLLARKDGSAATCEVTVRMLPDGLYLGIVRDVSARKLAEDNLRSSLSEKEVMLREIHHRVKNNMQVIVSLLNLQAKEIEDDTAASAFREASARIRSMALIHEKLYRGANFADVDMEDYCHSLMRSLMAATRLPGLSVSHACDVSLRRLPIEQAVPCALLINELASNSIKHAFHGKRQGSVKITFSLDADSAVLTVEDDGAGFDPLAAQNSPSLGFTLIRAWCEQLRGDLSVTPGEAGRGSRVIVRFPLAETDGRQ